MRKEEFFYNAINWKTGPGTGDAPSERKHKCVMSLLTLCFNLSQMRR